MTISVKHKFTSPKADGVDSTLIQPSNWNSTHDITMATARLIGRTTAGTGTAEEISVGTQLQLAGGILSISATATWDGSYFHATSSAAASLATTTAGLQAGATSTANVVVGNNGMQARNNAAAAQLNLNTNGGAVSLSMTGHSVFITSANDTGLASISPLVIGTTGAQNLALSRSALQSRANGVASAISINGAGGNITLGGSASVVTIDGSLDGDFTVTAGMTATAENVGTITTGSYLPAPTSGNFKKLVNGGAFTLQGPTLAGDYTLVIQVTNNASAGTITMTGFHRIAGDSLTTTNGHDFFLYITKVNGFKSVAIQALQ